MKIFVVFISFLKFQLRALIADSNQSVAFATERFSLACDYFAKYGSNSSGCLIDEQTWKDLRLSEYVNLVCQSASVFGIQALYSALRCGSSDDEIRGQRLLRMLLRNDEAMTKKLFSALRFLAPVDINPVSIFQRSNSDFVPKWTRIIASLTPFAYLSVVGLVCADYVLIAVLVFIVIIATSITVQIRMEPAVASGAPIWRTLERLLLTVVEICTTCGHLPEHYRKEFEAVREQSERLIKVFAFRSRGGEFDEYAKWFALKDVRHYISSLTAFEENREFLFRVMILVGRFEFSLCTAGHLIQSPISCEFEDGRGLIFSDLISPIVSNSQPIHFRANEKQAMLITGPNASGKSNFLRTIGLNIVLARTLGACYASAASGSKLVPISSMQITDAPQLGNSLFVAEVARVNEIVEFTRIHGDSLCLMDELFRGTNHNDATAVGSALLNELVGKAVVIATTHNRDMIKNLSPAYVFRCFREAFSRDCNVQELHVGVWNESNALTVLGHTQLGQRLKTSAEVFLLEKVNNRGS